MRGRAGPYPSGRAPRSPSPWRRRAIVREPLFSSIGPDTVSDMDPRQEQDAFFQQSFRRYASFEPWRRGVGGRPAWVTRLAVVAAVLVVVVPLAMLALTGLLVGMLVFFVASLLATMMQAVGSIFGGGASPSGSGRRNVRRNVRVVERP